MNLVKSLVVAVAMLVLAIVVLLDAMNQGYAKMADRKMLKKASVVEHRLSVQKMGQKRAGQFGKGITLNLEQDLPKPKPVHPAGKKDRKKTDSKPAEPKTANDPKAKTAGDKKTVQMHDISPSEKRLLVKAVYGEARGESFRGQVAVAAVILNRTEHAAFPDSVREVIYQENAFTAVEDGQIHLKPDKEAVRAVEQAIKGEDPTHGAVYYYNPEIATSEWMKDRAAKSQKLRIGDHVFFK